MSRYKTVPSFRFSPEQLCRALENAHVGIVLTDQDGIVLSANQCAQALLDLRDREIQTGKATLTANWRNYSPSNRQILLEVARLGEWMGEISLRHRNGELHRQTMSLSALRDERGNVCRYLGLVSNDALAGLPSRLARSLAHVDALTGLPNRLLLNDRLEQAIAVNRRNNTLLAICFMDLDGFKQVNDTLGHAAGDELLKHVASRMLFSLRDSDTVARVGGDEFVMLLSGLANEDECRQTLNRLLDEIATPYMLDATHRAEITMSIGVAMYPVDDSKPAILLEHADQAMYAAKKAGKNRFQMFDARLEERMQARQRMLTRVNEALEKHEFELYYQPALDVREHRVVSLEALLRWPHPELGMLAPGEFIPLIAEDELARHLGSWVLEQALIQARNWHAQGLALPVSVNVFARQILSMDFPNLLRQLISKVWPEMPPGRLILEVQECQNPLALPRMQESMLACRTLGVSFALDDFGVGASAISSLRNLNLSQIKICQSFNQEQHCARSGSAIIRSIVDLADAFSLALIIEGVETAEIIPTLQSLGAHIMQGYAIAHPMPASEIPAWVEKLKSAPEKPIN